MDSQNADDVFEIEIDTFNENEIGKLLIFLFEEIEADLCDRLITVAILRAMKLMDV